MAYTLANGLEYLRASVAAGLEIDAIAPRISFFWAQGKNLFMEVAKMRAARVLWAKLVRGFNPKNPKSMALRAHSQTSGWTLTEQDPYNNIPRTCIEAMAAVMGHTQSLHTNSLDEALALPTDFSARIARNTQLFLQQETNLCAVVDPLGGSYYLESLTDQLMKKGWAHICEIEAIGGMAHAVKIGLPQRRIEEASARRQAKIDSGKETIIGVNHYRLDEEAPMIIREVDNSAVRESQINRLNLLKRERDETLVSEALTAITAATMDPSNGNLLDLSIRAAKVRATLGEISSAIESVVGRHKAVTRPVSGVYGKAYGAMDEIKLVQERVLNFVATEGRRPRILIAKLGQDGHDRGAKVVATAMADLGFDVDLGPLFQTPEEAARQAVENDVHIVALNSLAGGHKTLLPLLVNELKRFGRGDILVVAGGLIPPQDHEFLRQAGAAAIFGPGTRIPIATLALLETLLGQNQP